MTISPPGSPTGATPTRPMSAIIRPPRSMSRMSTGSRPGGSRASDEESKTAVKVGTCDYLRFFLWNPILDLLIWYSCVFHSCPCATTTQTNRSRLRINPPAIPALHGPCDFTNQSGRGCSTGTQTVRLRSRFPRNHRSGRNLAVPQ